MVKIGLVGYGRIGKQIADLMKTKGLVPAAIVDPCADGATAKEINRESLNNANVIIDFSSPDVIMENIEKYIQLGINAVIGTTGWFDNIDKVKKLTENKIGLIWSGNFSLGVNLYFKIVEYASNLIGNLAGDSYDPMVHEFHHNQKKDSPSGTAIMIADLVKAGFNVKDSIVTERLDRKREDNELHVSSTRGGYIPGTHIVMFDSLVDTIELKHTARSREGFVVGALTAAFWIADKKGFYNFSEIFNTIQ